MNENVKKAPAPLGTEQARTFKTKDISSRTERFFKSLEKFRNEKPMELDAQLKLNALEKELSTLKNESKALKNVLDSLMSDNIDDIKHTLTEAVKNAEIRQPYKYKTVSSEESDYYKKAYGLAELPIDMAIEVLTDNVFINENGEKVLHIPLMWLYNAL